MYVKSLSIFFFFYLFLPTSTHAQITFSSSELSPKRPITEKIRIKIFQPTNNGIAKNGSFRLKFYLFNNSNEDIYISAPYCLGIDPSPFQFMVNNWNTRWSMTPSCYGAYKEKCILKVEAGSAKKYEILVSDLRTSFVNETGIYKVRLSYNFLFKSEERKRIYHMIRNKNPKIGLRLSEINTAWSNEIEVIVE